MPSSTAVTITIGAVLAGSFAASLGSATKGLGTLSKQIADTGKKASELGKVVDLARKKDDLEEKAAAGNAAAFKSLAKVSEQYRKAAESAGVYGKSLAQLESMQGKLGKEMDRLGKMQNMRSSLSAVGAKLQGAMPGAAALGGASMAGIGLGMDFDKAISRVGAVSRASAEDLAKLRAQAKQLGNDTEWSASQAAEGMQYLAMAGFKTEQIMQAMPGMLQLASAGGVDLGRASDIASNILTGFGMKAEEMGKAGDILVNAFTSSNTTLESFGQSMKYVAPAATAFGLDMAQTAALVGKLGDAGIQADQAGTALRQMMIRMAKQPKQVQKAMAQLGISFSDATGKMKPMSQILAEMADKEKGMTEQQKLSTNAAIFGTEALSAGIVLMKSASSGALLEYEKALRKTGTAAETAGRQQDNLGGDVTKAQSAFQGLVIDIYEKVEPNLRKLVQGVTDVIGKIHDWVNANPELTKTIAEVAGAIGGIGLASGPFGLVFKTLGGAGALAKGPVALLAGALGKSGGGLGAAMAPLAGPAGLLLAVAGGFAAAYASSEDFRKAIDPLIDGAKALGEGLINGVGPAIHSIMEGLDSCIQKFFDLIGLGDTSKGVVKAANDFEERTGVDLHDSSDADIVEAAEKYAVPHAEGGLVTRPHLGLVGEDGPELIVPLEKLRGIGGPQQSSGMTVTFAPVINLSGAGQDAYAAVRRGLNAGADDLRRTLEDLMTQRRRLAFD